MVGHCDSVLTGLDARSQDEHTVVQNGLSSDGLLIVMAPCFKTGGFDFYANGDITCLLNASLSNFGLREPILISSGPIRVGEEYRYLFKLVSRIEWNRKLCHSVVKPNNQVLRSTPTTDVERNQTKGKCHDQ